LSRVGEVFSPAPCTTSSTSGISVDFWDIWCSVADYPVVGLSMVYTLVKYLDDYLVERHENLRGQAANDDDHAGAGDAQYFWKTRTDLLLHGIEIERGALC
jgi:hypothetical protein